MPAKRVQIDEDTGLALDLLARDQRINISGVGRREAFAELLKKNNRLVGLNDALGKSAGHSATVHHLRPAKKKARARR